MPLPTATALCADETDSVRSPGAAPKHPAALAALAAATAALAACGGGGSDPVAGVPPPPPPPPTAISSREQAARLLAQASFGAPRSEIDRCLALGLTGWLDEQFAMARSQSHVDWLRANGYETIDQVNSRAPLDRTLWRKFLSSPDQLRQRVVYALSQIMVVAVEGVGGRWPAFAVAYYLDVLEANAFGNFRTLLEQVTLTPAMGTFLSMRGSRKADTSGRAPDENYAREVMQLFSIGLVALQGDGTPRTVGGAQVDSYGQADVTGLARIFTGWDYASAATDTAVAVVTPMAAVESRHETGVSSFLGATVPAGTNAAGALRIALDTLFNHPNVGPFIGRQLIQRLIMSNPSAAYVGRVAAVFADNGSGVRGDLRAVLRALLTDVEARDSGSALAAPGSGKLREPVLRFTQWARACGATTSASNQWRLGNLSDPATRLGQSPLHAPSVFNFYRPGYVAPGTAAAGAGLVAPELQITTETSVAGYLNFMQGAVATSSGVAGSDIRADYSAWLALAADAAALVDEANLVLAAGQLSAASATLIRNAIAAMPAGTDAQRLQRVQAAVLLTLGAPEFLVLK